MIALLPKGDAQVEGSDDVQPLHLTLVFLGPAQDLTPQAKDGARQAADAIARTIPPFAAKSSGLAYLGEDKAVVALVQHPSINRAHQTSLTDPHVQAAAAPHEHSTFLPHVTQAYGKPIDDVPAPTHVEFDRVAVMLDGSQYTVPLSGAPPHAPEDRVLPVEVSELLGLSAAVTPPDEQAAALAQHRDEVERHLAEAYLLALAAAGDGDKRPSAEAVAHVQRAFATALMLSATLARSLSSRSRPQTHPDDNQALAARAEALTDEAIDAATREISSRPRSARTQDPLADDPFVPNESWANARARSAATRETAQAVIDAAPGVAEMEGVPLSKVWVSQGDHKVRPLHRELHGRVRGLGKPFWRELSSGDSLSYPGDPDAPVGQTANCRCVLILAHSDEAAHVESVLTLPDTEAPGAMPVAAAVMTRS
jgi:hypothetical protein